MEKIKYTFLPFKGGLACLNLETQTDGWTLSGLFGSRWNEAAEASKYYRRV